MSLWKLLNGRWGSGAGETDEIRIDGSTNALEIIEYEHHEIHAGSHYYLTSYADVANNNVLDVTWLMPNTTKWTHWTWKLDPDIEILWQLYEGVIATNPLSSTAVLNNSNRNSINTSGTTLKYELQTNLAAANADTDVSGGLVLGSGKIGSGKSGGAYVRAHELVMDQGALYCLRTTALAAGYINYDLQWYEHTNKH